MDGPDELRRAVADVTPERLSAVLAALDAGLPAANRGAIPVRAVLEGVAGGLELDEGEAGWTAQLALTRAVKETAALIPGVRYFEGDS
ncbi:MAG: hypothetical protein R6X16_00585 [Anaerolineae bacterium]